MEFLIGVGIFVALPIIVTLLIISLTKIVEQFNHKSTDTGMSGVETLVCSVDVDCPTGYICVNGKCVPENKWDRSMSSAG